MGLAIRALSIYMPDFAKRMAVIQLWQATAGALGAEMPPIAALGYHECLEHYARFTQALAAQRLRDGRDLPALEQRLYDNAVELGRRQGQWLRPRTMQDVMAIGRVLYRILDIDLQGDARGDMVISRCYFSRFYSAEVCRLISAMDRGLFAGLSNGGELTFTARITEGQPCCRAHFSWAVPK